MPNPEEVIFEEVHTAFEAGNRTRARDLLTRLLKVSKENPEYWIWMSAAVETPRERAYCLKEALRLSPDNPTALRGLSMMGQVAVPRSQVLPARFQKRAWEQKQTIHPTTSQGIFSRWGGLSALLVIAAIGIVIVIVWSVFAGRTRQQSLSPTYILFHASSTSTRSNLPVTPSATSKTLVPGGTASTSVVSISRLLKETFTPTPLYVNTPHPRSEAFQVAMRDFQRGDWTGMEAFMKQVITAEPNSADAYFYLGEAARFQKKYKEAIQYYNKALAIAPDMGAVYLGRAQVTYAQNPNAVNQVQNDLETAIQKDPQLGEAYLELGQILVKNKDNKTALDILTQAKTISPNSAQVYLLLGQLDLQTGDAESALDNARQANQLDSTLLPAYLLMGQALQAVGDMKGSMEPLDTYLQYDQGNAQSWYALAVAQVANWRIGDAIVSAGQALTLNPQFADAYSLRGKLYLTDGLGSEALDDYRAAIRLGQDTFEVNMGAARALLMQKYPGDAYVQISRVQAQAQTDAQKAEFYYWRARSLDDLHEYVASLRDWQALLALPVKNVPAQYLTYAKGRITDLTELTPSPTATQTAIPTDTRVPTATLRPTITPVPSFTPSPISTRTLSPTPTP